MHRNRLLLLTLVSAALGAAACGGDDGGPADQTIPVVPTTPPTAAPPTDGTAATTSAATTLAPTAVPTTTVSPTTTSTVLPQTTVAETTVPDTTLPETTLPDTTLPETTVPETTEPPETTVAETTLPETTVPETTEPPETTVAETALPGTTLPGTTLPETTEPPETTLPETTLPETTEPPETTSITTATTAAPASSIPPGTLPIADVVQLGGDGLGIVTFGAEPEAAIAAVTAVLGEPTEDTDWSDPLAISTCSGTQVRRVSWGSLSLYFGDDSPVAQGSRHFFAYSYGTFDDLEAAPVGLATPEGIGLGSTVEFLRAAYPAVVVEPGEEGIIEPNFFVSDVLSGRLTGGGDADVVTVIIGGDACGV